MTGKHREYELALIDAERDRGEVYGMIAEFRLNLPEQQPYVLNLLVEEHMAKIQRATNEWHSLFDTDPRYDQKLESIIAALRDAAKLKTEVQAKIREIHTAKNDAMELLLYKLPERYVRWSAEEQFATVGQMLHQAWQNFIQARALYDLKDNSRPMDWLEVLRLAKSSDELYEQAVLMRTELERRGQHHSFTSGLS